MIPEIASTTGAPGSGDGEEGAGFTEALGEAGED
jgi:hypothetical protein